MAKVTITFEDLDDGVQVKIESDPAFLGPAASEEEKAALTEAQHMGIRMAELLTEELYNHEHHECGPECDHEHEHDPA